MPDSESNQPNEKEIFLSAMDIEDHEARRAYLDSQCKGDQQLRERIERLIEADKVEEAVVDRVPAAVSFLDNTTLAAPPKELLGPPQKPRTIRYFGNYEILEEIARGGMGVVYRAKQTNLNREVAIKMIQESFLASEMGIRRFTAEAEAAAALDHANIVPIYEIGEHEGQYYFSMKLVEGGSLQDALDSFKDKPRKAAEFMRVVAGAIHAAHLRGILHRDIKPANILIGDSGEPLVTDFGLAREVGKDSELTLTGQIVGTPHYMAPEQAKGKASDLTLAADVYSLGAVLYEMLSGSKLYPGRSYAEILRQVEEMPVKPLSQVCRAPIDRDLETILMKCLEKEPEKRYAGANDLSDDLGRWLDGKPIHARPVGKVERITKWMRRRPFRAAFAGVATLFVLVLSIGVPLTAIRQAKLKSIAEKRGQELVVKGQELASQGVELRDQLYAAKINLANQANTQIGGGKFLLKYLEECVPGKGEEDLRGWEWYYLRSRCMGKLDRFSFPGTQILSIDIHPDGMQYAVGFKADGLKIVDAKSHQIIKTLSKLQFPRNLNWSPDGKSITCSSKGVGFVIRDAQSGEVLWKPPKPSGGLGLWNRDRTQIAITSGSNVRVFDGPSFELAQTVDYGGQIHAIHWHPDGSTLAVTGVKGKKFFDVKSGKRISLLPGNLEQSVGLAAWSPDGKWMVMQTWDQKFSAKNLETGKMEYSISYQAFDESGISCFEFSPDGKTLALGMKDETVRILDLATGDLLAHFKGSDGLISSMAFDREGKRLASVGETSEVVIWDPHFRDLDREIKTIFYYPDVILSPNGKRLMVGGRNENAEIAIYDLASKQVVTRLHARDKKPKKTTFVHSSMSPDGKHVIGSSYDSTVRIWDAESGAQLKRLEMGAHSAFSWHQNRPLVACTVPNWGVKILNFESGEIDEIKVPSQGREAEFSPDGKTIAALAKRTEVHLYDESGKLLKRIKTGLHRTVTTLAWSPDGKHIAVGADLHGICIIDAASGLVLRKCYGHIGRITDIAWNPTGTRFAATDFKGWLKIWHAERGEVLASFKGPVMHSVSWSADGKSIATGADGAVFVRNASQAYEKFGNR